MKLILWIQAEEENRQKVSGYGLATKVVNLPFLPPKGMRFHIGGRDLRVSDLEHNLVLKETTVYLTPRYRRYPLREDLKKERWKFH